MPSDPTANAAGAAALASASVANGPAPIAPAVLPVETPGATAIADAPPPDTSQTFKSAQEMISASPDDLAKRYALPADEPVVEDVPVAEGAAPAAATTDPAAPAGETPAAPVTPAIEPITKFSLSDDEGELEIPMNVKLTFNADGREYKDLRLDEVVRMAQRAPLAARYQQEAEAAKPVLERAQQVEAAYTQARAELEQNNALTERLLGDPTFYQDAATRYAQLNTPEQRMARLEQTRNHETEQLRSQLASVQLGQTIAAAREYTATRIAPSVDALTSEYPSIESGDVLAKFHELTAPLLAQSPSGGVWVPPAKLRELETTVLPQLRAWAAEKHGRLTERTRASQATAQAQTAQAQAQTRQAQLAAQTATRRAARPLTPLGNAPAADVPKPKPIKTSGDAIDAALMRVQQQIAQAGAA